MRCLVPIGTKHHKLTYLCRRAYMLAYARTHIVIAYTHQTQSLAGILWQSVEFHIGRNMVAINKLMKYEG